MSNQFQKAAEDIQSLAARFKGIVDLGEALGKVGAIDQLVKESDDRFAAAKAAEKEAQDATASAQLQLSITKAKVEAAKQQVDDVLAGADRDAKKLIADAHAEADAVVEMAKKVSQDISDHAAKVKADSDATNASLLEKEAEYDALVAKIAELKKQFLGS